MDRVILLYNPVDATTSESDFVLFFRMTRTIQLKRGLKTSARIVHKTALRPRFWPTAIANNTATSTMSKAAMAWALSTDIRGFNRSDVRHAQFSSTRIRAN